jgi:hypothetical protein
MTLGGWRAVAESLLPASHDQSAPAIESMSRGMFEASQQNCRSAWMRVQGLWARRRRRGKPDALAGIILIRASSKPASSSSGGRTAMA